MISNFKICVLISGGGTTLRNLIEWNEQGSLIPEIDSVISSNPSAKGLKFAEAAGIESRSFSHREFNEAELSENIFRICREREVDLVVMGGFLRKLVIPEDFANRAINIHPSLIPSFCGKGFYGKRVHQAVVEYGCKLTGCTVHFVDNLFDHGPIIAQRTVPVLPADNAEAVANRVFKMECELYPAVINQIASGKVEVHNRIVTIHSD